MITRAQLLRVTRTLLLACVLIVAALGVLAIRTLVTGEEALDEAERAFDRGDLRESVRQARRAASAYLPFAPHVDSAYQRLVVIARGAEAAGRPHVAAFAWNALRSAALETSAPGLFPRPELEQANRSLARLASRLEKSRAAPDPKAESDLLTSLERPPRATAPPVGALAAGLLLVVAGLFWGGIFGVTAEGRLVARQALLALGLIVVGAACWTLAVYRT
jgi:HAMP domain-containing protein